MMENRKFDVIVAGAGPAGFCAAIAAARMKSRVLLAENSDSILGNLTSGPLEAIMTFHDEKRQVVKGIAEEFVSRCRREQGSLGHIAQDMQRQSRLFRRKFVNVLGLRCSRRQAWRFSYRYI